MVFWEKEEEKGGEQIEETVDTGGHELAGRQKPVR